MLQLNCCAGLCRNQLYGNCRWIPLAGDTKDTALLIEIGQVMAQEVRVVVTNRHIWAWKWQ
jgi:hypothetical protein